MTTFILLGEKVIQYLNDTDWQSLEESIFEDNTGEIIAWNKETDEVSELLEQLRGWEDFIILGEKDLKLIEQNTKIEIEW